MENQYEVVWPLGKLAMKKTTLAPRLPDLEGKTILELNHYHYKGDDIFPALRDSLKKRYKNINFIEYDVLGNFRESKKFGVELEKYEGLKDLFEQYHVDALVVGMGACGACTPATVRMAAAAEKCGIPTASLVITGFLAQGRLVAKSQGLQNMNLAEYPGTMMTDSAEELVKKVDTVLVENVIKALTTMQEGEKTTEPVITEPNPRDTVFKGNLIEVNDHFYGKLWTDGLPIIPPTLKEVEKFLSFTDRKPEEVIAVLLHENREATIWNIAVNGVMAGCRPEYMPILIAIVEAISDPAYHVQDSGCTPGWEPLIIINGPIIKELDFNYGQGVLRVGRQPNSSIGRFLKLYKRNVCGIRIPPGAGDKGSIGQNFNVVLAENEDAVKEIGWQPYSVDRGFVAGDNIITVMSSDAVSPPTYSEGSTAIEHLETIAEVMGRRFVSTYSYFALSLKYEPMFMIGPAVAKILAKDGFTKEKVKEYFFENIKVSVAWLQKIAMDFNGRYLDVSASVKKGDLPPEYGDSNDLQRLVKCFPNPQSIQLVVSGDPARNQSKAFIQNGPIGVPTSRKIVLPANWQQRLKEKN
jgi:hypothetical protein